MSATDGKLAKSKDTPRLSSEHHPLGHEGLWHTPDKHSPDKQQLPAYHQNIAHALMRGGMGESQAIATAINATRRWAEGGDHVHPEVRQAAQRALEEFERLKQSHHGPEK